MLTYDPITPAGRIEVTADFTDLLPEDVTLVGVTATCEVFPGSQGTDATPDARRDGPCVKIDDVFASQHFHQGVADVTYVIRFLGTFSDGQVEPIDVLLPVERFMPK
jgi:hypothetical protein